MRRLYAGVGCLLVLLCCAAPTQAATTLVSERLQQPLTAKLREVDFESAMNFLAEAAGITIVLSPKAKEVAQPISVHLVEIPLQRALDYLVKGQNLVYRVEDTAIFVSTLDEMEAEPLETRIFPLKRGMGLFADFEPIQDTRDSVALQSVGLRKLRTIKDVLEQTIPQVESSSFLLDERTGALIVTHVPFYLGKTEELLLALDVLPLEVRIEARFVELTVTNTDEWSLDAQLTGNAALITGVDRDGTTKSPAIQLSSVGTDLRRGTKIDFTDFSRSGEALNLTLQGVLTGTQYSSVLHALSETKKAKTLSSPQVTTLNNQTATIKVVTEFVYASRYEASVKREDLNGDGKFDATVNGVRETRFVNVPQDFVTKDLGILLNVTPSIGHDLRTVTLALKPEVSEKKTDDTFAGEIKLPRFTSRYLTSSVVIEDGETVVLGGLMKDTTTNVLTKVPLLSSIPVIGKAFQKRSSAVERSNLVIFVTAHVVKPSPQLAQSSPDR
ncbi:MAG: hypothetical protein HYY15_03690 [Candidatus Omnitrophica bacterium]|nr:hypothetical protein [Candidatus Omnitrophota bacterium]